MKKLFICISLLLLIFFSCNRKQPPADNADDPSIITQCYTSVFGSDSARMVLREKNGSVSGQLYLFFSSKPDLRGTIEGNFRGDTLFSDFTYNSGTKPERFRNPMAFLKKGGKLYQGYGIIITSIGQTSFKKGEPIAFDKGFVFERGECE